MKPFLLALDFDNTIVQHRSDRRVNVQPLFPGSEIPRHLEETRKSLGWDAFLKGCFKELAAIRATREDIAGCFGDVDLVTHMAELIELAERCGGETIVITDSHTANVEAALVAKGLRQKVSRIFANRSWFDEDSGELRFEDDGDNNRCEISRRAICKGDCLESYLRERRESDDGVEFGFVAFVGDGDNDLCSVLRLGVGDVAFARKNYALAKTLRETATEADNVEWETGHEIWTEIQKRLLLLPS